jgi:hypothetical protein
MKVCIVANLWLLIPKMKPMMRPTAIGEDVNGDIEHWNWNQLTATHHGAHFHCTELAWGSIGDELGALRLSNVEGPVMPR